MQYIKGKNPFEFNEMICYYFFWISEHWVKLQADVNVKQNNIFLVDTLGVQKGENQFFAIFLPTLTKGTFSINLGIPYTARHSYRTEFWFLRISMSFLCSYSTKMSPLEPNQQKVSWSSQRGELGKACFSESHQSGRSYRQMMETQCTCVTWKRIFIPDALTSSNQGWKRKR